MSPVTNVRCCPEPGSEDLLHHSVSSGQVLEQKSLYKLSKCLAYNRIILNKIQNLHCKPQPLLLVQVVPGWRCQAAKINYEEEDPDPGCNLSMGT